VTCTIESSRGPGGGGVEGESNLAFGTGGRTTVLAQKPGKEKSVTGCARSQGGEKRTNQGFVQSQAQWGPWGGKPDRENPRENQKGQKFRRGGI